MREAGEGEQGLYRPEFEHESCGVGFVARLDGQRSHETIRMGLDILKKLSHRGATGADSETGDGAGILIQLPDSWMRRETAKLGIQLPEPGKYAVGMVFMPKEPGARNYCEGLFERLAGEQGLRALGWREVPVAEAACGPSARATCPLVFQVFVDGNGLAGLPLARRLYTVRKAVENAVAQSSRPYTEAFYICSLSAEAMVYKGQFLAHQIELFYPELTDTAMESALAVVHQRYSTNTFPSWKLAHPYRYLAHNGEINTIRGNQQWFRAREGEFEADWYGASTTGILPVMQPGCSDSGNLDNAFELLVLSGYSLAHAMRTLIPEAWRTRGDLTEAHRAFYAYHENLMEPWDGPAAVVFTDGRQVGATLDRNGLRPARYVVTRDNLVVLASEAGVVSLPEERILRRGKLGPGELLLVDVAAGTLRETPEIMSELAAAQDYAGWLKRSRKELPMPGKALLALPEAELTTGQQIFGYTEETLKRVLAPLAAEGHEAMSSMGNDTPLAVLSPRPKLLFDYFRQLFAQVTNPPIDPLREKAVMALNQQLGGGGNLLSPHVLIPPAEFLELEGPVLSRAALEGVLALRGDGLQSVTLPMVFEADEGARGLAHALEALKNRAEEAVRQGYRIILLSDRAVDRFHAPVPGLLAVSAVHSHLIACRLRARADIIVESGEVQDPFHVALLTGYGATAVHPWLALESLRALCRSGVYTGVLPWEEAEPRIVKALEDGVLKIISKMGISVLKSFMGARIFEAVGLGRQLVTEWLPGTINRLPAVELETVAEETLMRHREAFTGKAKPNGLALGGQIHWQKGDERHLMGPEVIARLQQACRTGDEQLYREYAALVDGAGEGPVTLRGLLTFKPGMAVPLSEVDTEEALMRRFCTGAMSFGSLSREMHETLAVAMNRIGGRSNSGEGGEAPERYRRPATGDYSGSVIKQVAAARFGVTAEYLAHAEELQIKVAQGAKPGEGGHLPGEKVTPEIARVRHSVPGISLISPPPHHDIYSIEDLEQLIFDLKNINTRARVSVKLVSEAGVGTVAAGVAKGNADVILISGHDGGTGAAPLTSIRTAGLPWEIGLAEAHQTLLLNNLRGRVTLQCDGQMRTGRDVAVAALLGAEEFAFATAPLVVCGCIQMRKCHENTCPVGVATQDPELRKHFKGKPEHVIQFFRFIARELREHMALLGFRTLEEMVGRTDRLQADPGRLSWKTRNLELDQLLHRPEMPQRYAVCKTEPQPNQTLYVMDRQLVREALGALEQGRPFTAERVVHNTDRSLGTLLAGELAWRYGETLPAETVRLNLRGSAGQSFGAFLSQGVTLALEGEANDYLGKGLSGGRLILRFPRESALAPGENVIAGNTLLYGATAGEAFIAGRAGERFCVRNSGALAVVEGLGDHGCEYMTGGRVVVLGTVGWNFAAGMSGGIAYLYDEDGTARGRINTDMVQVEPLEEGEAEWLRGCLRQHLEHTESLRAKTLLEGWRQTKRKFLRVISPEYAKAFGADGGQMDREVG